MIWTRILDLADLVLLGDIQLRVTQVPDDGRIEHSRDEQIGVVVVAQFDDRGDIAQLVIERDRRLLFRHIGERGLWWRPEIPLQRQQCLVEQVLLAVDQHHAR